MPLLCFLSLILEWWSSWWYCNKLNHDKRADQAGFPIDEQLDVSPLRPKHFLALPLAPKHFLALWVRSTSYVVSKKDRSVEFQLIDPPFLIDPPCFRSSSRISNFRNPKLCVFKGKWDHGMPKIFACGALKSHFLKVKWFILRRKRNFFLGLGGVFQWEISHFCWIAEMIRFPFPAQWPPRRMDGSEPQARKKSGFCEFLDGKRSFWWILRFPSPTQWPPPLISEKIVQKGGGSMSWNSTDLSPKHPPWLTKTFYGFFWSKTLIVCRFWGHWRTNNNVTATGTEKSTIHTEATINNLGSGDQLLFLSSENLDIFWSYASDFLSDVGQWLNLKSIARFSGKISFHGKTSRRFFRVRFR